MILRRKYKNYFVHYIYENYAMPSSRKYNSSNEAFKIKIFKNSTDFNDDANF